MISTCLPRCSKMIFSPGKDDRTGQHQRKLVASKKTKVWYQSYATGLAFNLNGSSVRSMDYQSTPSMNQLVHLNFLTWICLNHDSEIFNASDKVKKSSHRQRQNSVIKCDLLGPKYDLQFKA